MPFAQPTYSIGQIVDGMKILNVEPNMSSQAMVLFLYIAIALLLAWMIVATHIFEWPYRVVQTSIYAALATGFALLIVFQWTHPMLPTYDVVLLHHSLDTKNFVVVNQNGEIYTVYRMWK